MDRVARDFADRVVAHLSHPEELLQLRSDIWRAAAAYQREFRGNAELTVLLPSDPSASIQAYGEREFLKDRKVKGKSVEAKIWTWKKNQLPCLSLDRLAIRGQAEKMPKWKYVNMSNKDVFHYIQLHRRRWAFPCNVAISHISDKNVHVEKVFGLIPTDYQIYNFEHIHGHGGALASLLNRMATSTTKNLKVNISTCILSPEARDAVINLLRPNCKTTIQLTEQDITFFDEEYLNHFYTLWVHQPSVKALIKIQGVEASAARVLAGVPWNHHSHPREGERSVRCSHVNIHTLSGGLCLVEVTFD
uniref:FBA_2 domain-containing protein n=1 Tax=Steinernema glaseri TaxID=37863 RepID=A0A1I7YDY0_9BILA